MFFAFEQLFRSLFTVFIRQKCASHLFNGENQNVHGIPVDLIWCKKPSEKRCQNVASHLDLGVKTKCIQGISPVQQRGDSIYENHPRAGRFKTKEEISVIEMSQIALTTNHTDQLAATPSKRRLKTTTEYIYDTLFKDGKDSDVVVKALGTSWNLHKVTYHPIKDISSICIFE